MNYNFTVTNEEILAIRQQPAEKHSAYWSEEDKLLLEEMYLTGVDLSKTAVYFKRSETAIGNMVDRMKLSQKVKRNRTKKCGCRCPECESYSGGKCTMSRWCETEPQDRPPED